MAIKRILIVDDDEITLKLLEQHLLSAGYPVLKAKNGKQAIELAKAKKPALILLDVVMPEVDGADVAQFLRDDPATKDIPIIFLTAMLKKEEEQRIGNAIGKNLFIAKPYDKNKLLEIVRKNIDPKEGEGRKGIVT